MTFSVRAAVLYISYDGLLEPLGQSQVLAYLEKLSEEWLIHVVSYEKRQDRQDVARMEGTRNRLKKAGISWTPLAYHKSPSAPATAYDIALGTVVAVGIALRHKVAIVHARSYVPAVIALAVKRFTGAKFLFDMRGFWADERVDGGLWPREGILYRSAKSMEKQLLQTADHIVTLTHASKREITRFPYLKDRMPALSVIPTCANLQRFKPAKKQGSDWLTLGYVGSIGMSQPLDEVFRFYQAVTQREKNARLLFVNQSQHASIVAAAQRAGIKPERIEIVSAEHSDVPNWIAKMSVGIAFYRPAYAEIARCPTKFAEYLACGVPCVSNVGVGDLEQYLESRGVGIALSNFSLRDHAGASERLLELLHQPDVRQRCVQTAQELFSLEAGVNAYREIYARLNGDDSGARSNVGTKENFK